MNNNISYIDAIQAALQYSQLELSQTRAFQVELQDGLYFISLRTEWQFYEFYVDSASGQVMGMNFEPSLDIYCDESDFDRSIYLCLGQGLAA